MSQATANLPSLYQSPNNVWVQQTYLERAFQGIYDGSNNLIYAMFAKPGSPVGNAVWQIMKLTYDGSNNLTSITWPVDSATNRPSRDYLFIQTSYASYTYA